ncbi:pyrimidodiazepine synthase-like isoform X1 [Zootermopsis nevadensis]|uniref:pyrimidodiazepine synthase-like isoform X1 n=1 Tax=Zootermopsis nevadensis TaxID=136037 RepID=UPI000B8E2DAD|nr:pyrimidodiazepine synthase-like isoform X1 [Zootermopsis nevadensis]
MSDKHLGKGSKNPPLSKGKLRLYSMRFDPYSQRVHLVLDAKKIPYDVVNVNLTEKPEWLYEKSPLGKVPTLELESGDCIYESMIIADYLDEKYPQRQLYPKDPLKKAKDKLLIDQFNKVISNLYRLYQNMDREFLDAVMKALDVFEREIVSRSKPFFGGDKPGMLDYMIWPWCERSEMLKIMGGDQFVLPRERFLRLMEWRNAMKEEESVKVSYLEPEIHAKYINSHRAGYADYDLLLKKLHITVIPVSSGTVS